MQSNFSDTKVIISLPTPRDDDEALNNKAQILGLMVKEEFRQTNIVSFCDNSNLSFKGRPISRFLEPQDKHLTNSGVAVFAANIRDTVDNVLGLRHRMMNQNNDTRPRQYRRDQYDRSSYPTYGSYENLNQTQTFRGRGLDRNNGGHRPYNRGYRGYSRGYN